VNSAQRLRLLHFSKWKALWQLAIEPEHSKWRRMSLEEEWLVNHAYVEMRYDADRHVWSYILTDKGKAAL